MKFSTAATGIRVFLLLLLSLSTFAAPQIIPLPVTLQSRPGVFTLCASQANAGLSLRSSRSIVVDAASVETGNYLAMMLARSTGCQFAVMTNNDAGAVRDALLLTTVNALPSLGDEGYELTVAPDSVVIRAPNQAGVFYGVQSLLQLLPPQILSPKQLTGIAWTAPCVYIQDQPRFPWRGVMLDVSRHFFDKQEVERILDAMALHKVNTFHWHLVDDQGWRIEIKSYPLLTATSAWRTNMNYGQNSRASTAYRTDPSRPYGGYYTQEDIREVVAYAQQRHITVVPEIELPAHCTSAVYAYPELGCGNPQSAYSMDSISYGISLFSLAAPGSWPFFTNVLTEVMALFPSKYIHTGGDEVVATGDTQWKTYSYDNAQMTALGINPAQTGSTPIIQYQHWFSTNLAAFLTANGRTMMGWSEFEAGGTVTNAVLMDWQTGTSSYASATASNKQYVVMSPNANCYINYYQTNGVNATNIEPYFIVGGNPSYQTLTNVYRYEPIPSNLNSAYTNYILGAQCNLWTEYVPSPMNVEFKMFPRLSALAELTWTPPALKNYNDFTNRLVTLKQRLTHMGINYNRDTIPQIGSWGPSVSTNATTVTYDITPYVTAAGEIDVSFAYTSGLDALNIFSATLLENGVQVDIDVHTGFAGNYKFVAAATRLLPYYILRLPTFHPGSTYTISASIAEVGSNASSNGKVYLPNWN